MAGFFHSKISEEKSCFSLRKSACVLDGEKVGSFCGQKDWQKRETKMDTLGCIQLARQWLNENASARLCLSDAIKNYDDGDFKAARIWAKKSLFHSVGIFHADYKRVETFSRKMGD